MIAAVADTHVVIWYLFDDARLSKTAKSFIENTARQGQQVAISSVTLIEMVYLIEKHRIPVESLSELAAELADNESVFIEIPLNLNIARSMTRVDVAQIADMPDRIVAATAVHLNVPVLSRDEKIKLSSIMTIW